LENAKNSFSSFKKELCQYQLDAPLDSVWQVVVTHNVQANKEAQHVAIYKNWLGGCKKKEKED
jgi:hypothetical protein